MDDLGIRSIWKVREGWKEAWGKGGWKNEEITMMKESEK